MTIVPVTGASCHNCMKSDIQTQLNKNISFDFFYREVSLIEKITKNWKTFFQSKHKSTVWKRQFISTCFFLGLKFILTMVHYIKSLKIFIRKFVIFWSWQLALWNLWQLAPVSFLHLQQAHGHHVWDIYVVDWPTYSVKEHLPVQKKKYGKPVSARVSERVSEC